MIDIDKEWIAVDGEEIIATASTKKRLFKKVDASRCPECGEYTLTDYEIVAVPKHHKSLFI